MKKIESVADLAVFGGLPSFAQPLHVGRPNISNREGFMRRLSGALDSFRLTNNGPLVQELERRIADYLGAAHCIAISNGTVALEIALRALGIGGSVIVPSFTFVATPHALRWLGLTPVFADVDPATHNLDPASVERSITAATTAIMGVHVWGRACAVDELGAIAQRHGLKLLFDAAHAFGCSHDGRMIGNFGECEVMSFHATKFFNTFEGGAILTNSDALAEKARLMRNFGFQGLDRVVSLGINGKMPEVSAAMGLAELEVIDETIAVNRRNYDCYLSSLSGLGGVSLVKHPAHGNFQYIIVEFDDTYPVSRDDVARIMHAENVLVRRYFHPGCHEMEPYRTELPGQDERLSNTVALSRRVLSFPSGRAVGEPEIEHIARVLRVLGDSGGVRLPAAGR